MHNGYRVALLGGDERMRYAALYLSRQAISLRVWGMGEDASSELGGLMTRDWESAVEGADVLVLPLPVSMDGVRLFAPTLTAEAAPRLLSLLESFEGSWVLGGRVGNALATGVEKRGAFLYDYFDAEPLQLKNALLTAEGAIHLAMSALPVALQGLEVAVAGYGRIGSLLADRLLALGAKVSLLARRREALTLAQLKGCRAISIEKGGLEEAFELPSQCRVLFNTVPARVLSPEALATRCPDCSFIELASVPGGIDHERAKQLGIRVLFGSALPGKYAAESAGIAVAEEIQGFLSHLPRPVV